jgi:hypothetical protein
LSGNDDPVAHFGASGNAALGDEQTISPDAYVMAYLYEIVQLTAVSYGRFGKSGPIYGAIRSDFYAVAEPYAAHMGQFFVSFRSACVAVSVAAYDGAAVNDAPISYGAVAVECDVWMQDYVVANGAIAPDGAVRPNGAAFADRHPMADGAKWANGRSWVN